MEGKRAGRGGRGDCQWLGRLTQYKTDDFSVWKNAKIHFDGLKGFMMGNVFPNEITVHPFDLQK